MTETIPTTFGVEYHLADVLDTVTVDIQVQSGSSLVDYPRASTVAQSVAIGAELIHVGAEVFRISAPTPAGARLRIDLQQAEARVVNDLAVFTVDDPQGRINGLAPGASGYLEAALSRSRDALSPLVSLPTGYDPGARSRELSVEDGAFVSMMLIQNDTLDQIRQDHETDPAVLFGTPEHLQITPLARGSYKLAWGEAEGSDFKDLVFTMEAVEAPLILASEVQGQPQAELLDLRSVDPDQDVEAGFEVWRDAAFDNVVGFYAIRDLQGTIVDPDSGAVLRPGDRRYADVALSNRLVALDLRVADQATTRLDQIIDGGSLLAPFLVANGTPELLLDADQTVRPEVYFPFIEANPDRLDHIRLLGNNRFGFEDLRGGGDLDCNDMVISVDVALL